MTAPDPADTVLVLTTLPSPDEARALVRELVDQRLAACGTILERVTSVYRWEGKVEVAAESQVMLKTRRGCWEGLQSAVQQLHPYDVPELLAVPIETGLPAYLEWVRSETTDPQG